MILNPYRYAASGGSDPHWASVTSLLHFDGTNGSTTFTDQKGVAWTSNGGAQISTADPKFGTGSGLFANGVNDYIRSSTVAGLGFATGDFTIEGWFKRSALNTDQGLYVRGLLSGGFNQSSLAHAIFFGSDNKLNQRIYTGGTNVTITTASAVTDTASYHHFAMCAVGSTLYAFLDGALVGSAAYTSQNDGGTWTTAIGSFGGVWGLPFGGRVDDVRVTKGVGRYTASFTPPTAAFPDS